MLTVKEVAERTGVTTRSVQKWIASGYLKAYQFGRKYRIDEKDFKEFVEDSLVKKENS